MPQLQSDTLWIPQFWPDKFREHRHGTGSGQKERHRFEHHWHSSHLTGLLHGLRTNSGNKRPPNLNLYHQI